MFASQGMCEGCGAQSSDVSSGGFCPDCQNDLYESESREAAIRPEATIDLWNLKTAVDEQTSMGACTKCGDFYAPEAFDEGLCPECEYARDWFDEQAIDSRHEGYRKHATNPTCKRCGWAQATWDPTNKDSDYCFGCQADIMRENDDYNDEYDYESRVSSRKTAGGLFNLRVVNGDYIATCQCGNTIYCDDPVEDGECWYTCSMCGLEGFLGVDEFKTARRRASRKTAGNWELGGLEGSWYLYAEDGSKSYAVLDDIHERTGDTFGQRWAWSVYNADFDEVAFGYADEMLDGQVDAERALSALTSTAKRKKAAYEISYQRFICPHCNERVLDDDLIDEAKFTGKCPHCGGGIAFDDRHQPGQMDVRVARRKTARQVAVENLQEGDLVDLEGDPYADPNRVNVRFENEFAEVDYVEINGGTVEVHFVDDWIGFPTGHTVEVAEDGYGAYYASRKTAAPVKFPSKCKECGASIPVGAGDVRKVNGAWYTTCDAHKPAPKQRRSTDWYEDDDDPDHHSRGYGVPGGRRY